MTNSTSIKELIAALRRDAGDYAKVAQNIPVSHELSWSARDVRAWAAADALEVTEQRANAAEKETHARELHHFDGGTSGHDTSAEPNR